MSLDFSWSSTASSLPHSASSPNLPRSQPASNPERSSYAPPSTTFTTVGDDMPCRDRTLEFSTAAKSLQMRLSGPAGPVRKTAAVAEALQFNQMAKRIGRELSETCAKLEKLTVLGKSSSLFNDRAGEMEELTQAVKTDIGLLNKQIGTLQEYVKSRRLGPNSSGQHSSRVVVGLQSKLAHVSQDFKSVLEARTETMKAQQTRREKFSGAGASTVPASLPASMSQGRLGSVLMAAEEDEARQRNGAVSLDMDAMEGARRAQQSQLQLVDQQESYVSARAEAMDDIQSSIVELGSIFRQLASLVQEQGETVQRIDQRVDETALNIDAAHTELLKYFQNISKNRWLFVKVFGVLIVFFIVFVVFLT